MNDNSFRFGFPNTLPPLGRRELRGTLVFAGMGLFVLLVGLFPDLRPPPSAALPLALCWLALPAWGIFKFLTRTPSTAQQKSDLPTSGTRTQVGLFTIFMVGVGVGYFFWARRLGVSPPIIFGSLLLIEGLGGVIVSLTEWWRLSHLGVSMGLVAGGFLLPLMNTTSVAVPVGGAFMIGSFVSTGILYWQMRQCGTFFETDVANAPS